MKILYKSFSMIAGLSLAITTVTSMSAYAIVKNVYVDNDDAQGHSNYRNGFNTYMTGSSHYLNDARAQATGNSNYFYQWNLDNDRVTSHSSITLILYAHMNDASFTDYHAQYEALCSYSQTINAAFNQNNAYGGWNTIGTVSLTPYTAVGENTVTLHGAAVHPYGNASCFTTAADDVRFYAVGY